MRKRKGATAISIIGGADGPTSVFLAGKWNDDKKRVPYRQKRDLNRKNKRLNKLKKRLRKEGIVSHTLEELEEYICTKYGAIAISQDSIDYQRALKSAKLNLVFKFFEDMIPMEYPVFPKENLSPKGLKDYNDKIQAWFKAAEKVELPDDKICFHYYKIEVLDGKNKSSVVVEFELKHQLLSVSSCYSSNKKSLYKRVTEIIKDIYFYYGATEGDMDEGSERFLSLAAVLQSDQGKKAWQKKKKRRWLYYLGFFFLIFALVKQIFKRISLFKNE